MIWKAFGRLGAAVRTGGRLVYLGLLRFSDVLLLLPRPHLWRIYAQLWWAEWAHSPYGRWQGFERQLLARGHEQTGADLVYGEAPLFTVGMLLRVSTLAGGGRFLDLGAGRGRALVAAAARNWRAEGIELVDEHCQHMAVPLRRVGIVLRSGDALQVPLSGDFIWLAWTGFSEALAARFVEHLHSVAPGTLIGVVDRPLPNGPWHVVKRLRLPFTWGCSPVWVYRRHT